MHKKYKRKKDNIIVYICACKLISIYVVYTDPVYRNLM